MKNWQEVAIGDLVQPVKTWDPRKSVTQSLFHYIDLSAVDQESKSIVGVRKITCHDAPSRARQLVENGDVLVSTVRPNLNGVALIPEALHGATVSTGFCVLRPKPSRLDKRYLYHWVKSPAFINDMVRKATGANYPAVSDRIISASIMPIPSLPEQRRIAAILDRADQLRAKRKRTLEMLNNLQQAIFLELFGDPATNSRGWTLRKCRDICERITVGIVVKPASYYVDDGVLALRSLNIKEGKIILDDVVYVSEIDNETRLAKTRLKPGDVIIVRSGRPRAAAVVPHELGDANAIDILIVTPQCDALDANYLCAFLNSVGGRNIVSSKERGQVQKHLNVGSLSDAEIPLPPLSLQRDFSTKLAGC
jgi:type I restriction enzyme S subunit